MRSIQRKKKNIQRNRQFGCEALESRQLLATVTSGADSGPGTLREALAGTDPIIDFDPAVTAVTLTSGQLDVTRAVTIRGHALTLTEPGDLLDCNSPTVATGGVTITQTLAGSRVMKIDDTSNNPATPTTAFADVVLENLIITGGNTNSTVQDDADGAGILSFENLTIVNSLITDNSVNDMTFDGFHDGGGISHGNETNAAGNLLIQGSVIENNFAIDDSAALDHYNANDLTFEGNTGGLARSTVRCNVGGDTMGRVSVGTAAFGYVGAIRVIDAVTAGIYATQTNTFDGFNFVGNRLESLPDDGSPQNLGGILVSDNANGTSRYTFDTVFQNSTISGNETSNLDPVPNDAYYAFGRGAGMFVTGFDGSTLSIADSEISGNIAHGSSQYDPIYMTYAPCTFCRGGGTYIQDITTVDVSNTVVADNYAYTTGAGMFVSNSTYTATTFTGDRLTVTGNGDGAIHGLPAATGSGGGLWFAEFDVASGFPLRGTLSNSTVSNNVVNGSGGGVFMNSGAGLDIYDTKILNNQAGYGAGVYSSTANTKNGSLTLSNVTVDGNTAVSYGGGVMVTGIYNGPTPAVLTVNNSTISNNVVTGDPTSTNPFDGSGAGISAGQAAGADPMGTTPYINANTNVTIDQSTISGNSAARDAGGLYLYSFFYGSTIRRSTITENVSDSDLNGTGRGGGVNNAALTFALYLDNSVVSGNTDNTGAGPDIYGTLASETSAWVGSNTGNNAAVSSGNAMLGALVDNGGPTETHEPMVGSGLIDAGSGARAFGFDQRGGVPGTVGAAVDIGSVEVGAVVPPSVECDFTGDGNCFIGDLDLLTTAVAGMSTDPQFDLDNSGVADPPDIALWLSIAGALPVVNGGTTCMAPWLNADFNLDESVGQLDFDIWNLNKFTNNTLWSLGNSDGNSVTDGGDFSDWNENKGTSACGPNRSGGGHNDLDTLAAESQMVAVAQNVRVSLADAVAREVPATTQVTENVSTEKTYVAPPAAISVTYVAPKSLETKATMEETAENRESALDRIFSEMGDTAELALVADLL